MSKHLNTRIVLNGKRGIEEKSIDLEEHWDNYHDRFLRRVFKTVRCLWTGGFFCGIEEKESQTMKASERITSQRGTDVPQTHWEEVGEKKQRVPESNNEMWRKVRKFQLERVHEEASGEERQLQQPRANPEPLSVSSPWEHKKRASEQRSHTGISHRRREQMSHKDVITVTINPPSLSSVFIHEGIRSKKRKILKTETEINFLFLHRGFGLLL